MDAACGAYVAAENKAFNDANNDDGDDDDDDDDDPDIIDKVTMYIENNKPAYQPRPSPPPGPRRLVACRPEIVPNERRQLSAMWNYSARSKAKRKLW